MKRNTDARNPKLFKTKGSVLSTDITLRDLIAALCAAEMAVRVGPGCGIEVSREAYYYADALLNQREKEPETWTV